MEYAFYVRYGLMGQVGRFCAPSPTIERGQSVVVRTRRGTELGEVLVPGVPSAPNERSGTTHVLRMATHDDLAAAERARCDRDRRFALCQQVFQEGVWPFDVIDVEPLLDEGRTVVHYLGPHDLDVSGLLAVFRTAHGLDVVFEPAGRDASVEPEPTHDDADDSAGCGHCGTGGGCGSGGCGTASDSAGGGCAGCAIMTRSKGRGRTARSHA